MTDSHEVIGAFVDGERVDASALKAALSTAEGRDYLADLVALREVVARDQVRGVVAPARTPKAPWLAAAAAVVLLSLAGGYAWGHRSAEDRGGMAAREAAPQPTRVIEVAPGASVISTGGK